MDISITFDELINVGKTIISRTKKDTNKNTLIIKSEYEKYDIVLLKSKLIELFSKYKSNCYSYKSNYNPKKTSHNNLIAISSNSIPNPVLDMIGNRDESQVYAYDFYNSLVYLSNKLMYREAVYLNEAFLEQQTEENIAEIIGISKTALQKYKKSAIVKTWIELESYFEELTNDY